jgi:hypothetical protein
MLTESSKTPIVAYKVINLGAPQAFSRLSQTLFELRWKILRNTTGGENKGTETKK